MAFLITPHTLSSSPMSAKAVRNYSRPFQVALQTPSSPRPVYRELADDARGFSSSPDSSSDEVVLYPRKECATDASPPQFEFGFDDSPSPSYSSASDHSPSSPPPQYLDENLCPAFSECSLDPFDFSYDKHKSATPSPQSDEHDPGFTVWQDGGIKIPPPSERIERRPFTVLYQSDVEPLSVLPSSLLWEFASPVSRASEMSPLATPRLFGFTMDQQSLLDAITQKD